MRCTHFSQQPREQGTIINHLFLVMRALKLRDGRPKGVTLARWEAAPLCLGGDITASRVLAAVIASRSDSISPSLLPLSWRDGGCGQMQAGALMLPFLPDPWGGPRLRTVRTHLQGARRPAQFSFLFPERLLTLVSRILFFPSPSPGLLALWPCPPLPTPPRVPPSNGQATDKGAFLQSGSPSSHKFSAPA